MMSGRRIVTLVREDSDNLGTFGMLDTGTFKCFTLERPRGIEEHPCIPAGEYDVDWTNYHPKHNPCYEVMRVPGRSAILLHSANWFQQLEGCLAPGTAIETVEGTWEGHTIRQKGVSGSGTALLLLLADLERKPFRIVISEER